MVLVDGEVALPAAGPFSCPSVVGALPVGPLLWLESQLVVLLVWAGAALLGTGGLPAGVEMASGHLVIWSVMGWGEFAN